MIYNKSRLAVYAIFYGTYRFARMLQQTRYIICLRNKFAITRVLSAESVNII